MQPNQTSSNAALMARRQAAVTRGVGQEDLRAHPLIALESSARLSPMVRAAFSHAGTPHACAAADAHDTLVVLHGRLR